MAAAVNVGGRGSFAFEIDSTHSLPLHFFSPLLLYSGVFGSAQRQRRQRPSLPPSLHLAFSDGLDSVTCHLPLHPPQKNPPFPD